MNDDFLYQFRRSPRSDFTQNLYKKLSRKNRRLPMLSYLSRISTMKRVGWALAAVCLSVALILTTSPTARANLLEMVRHLAGLNIKEVERPDGGPMGRPQTMSLDEVRDKLTFEFKTPTWVPENFILEDGVEFLASAEIIDLTWKSADTPTRIKLSVSLQDSFAMMPGKTEEISIKGQPGILAHNAWDPEAEQWYPHIVSIIWIEEGVTYSLTTTDDRIVSIENLINMAESMK